YTASPCPAGLTLPLAGTSTASFFANAAPFSPTPYRLVVKSTGYGPNGAVKQLEAIVRRNFFDGFDPPGTMLMVGPHTDAFGGTFHYDSGNSNGVTYSGGDCNMQCVPAFGVTDQANLLDIIN